MFAYSNIYLYLCKVFKRIQAGDGATERKKPFIMNRLKITCIENANAPRNIKKIEALAEEILSSMKEESIIKDGWVNLFEGTVGFSFAQEDTDGSDYYAADEYFHTEFNERVQMELPEVL